MKTRVFIVECVCKVKFFSRRWGLNQRLSAWKACIPNDWTNLIPSIWIYNSNRFDDICLIFELLLIFEHQSVYLTPVFEFLGCGLDSQLGHILTTNSFVE